MAVKKNPVQVQIGVTLTPQTYEFVTRNAANGDIVATLTAWCDYFADRQARGGIFLEPEDHDALAEMNGGKRFKDSRTLTTIVQKGLQRDDGQFSYRTSVDPAHHPAMLEQASNSGLTPQEFVDGFMQYIFASGQLYDFTPVNGRSIPFTANMLAATAALCEKKKIDSSDIAGLIAEDRFLPVERAVKAQIAALAPGKVDFDARDLARLLTELEKLRAENKALKAAPRELQAA